MRTARRLAVGGPRLRGLGDVEILLVRPRDPAAAPSAADYRALWNAAADESIAIVLEIWERYRKAGASWKTPGSPAPGVVEQTDPLIGSIAKADADDNDRDRLRGRFNSAVEYVFGKWGGDFMRKVQAWAATIGGEDAYWGKGAQDAAAAEIAAYTAAGWPLWPFWSDHRASSRSPYQIGKGYKDSNAAFEGMPAASQQAITKLWAMFVAHLDDPTIAYLARFGVSPWDNTPGSPAIVGDLDYPIATAVFGGSFDSLTPDHWWNVSGFAPVIAATIAAVHFGAPIDETRRATTRRFLTEVVEQDWTDHPTAGYAVPRAVEMRSGGSFTAWPMAEAARIAIEEAQASAPTLLLVRSRGATPAAPRTPEQRRELADKLPSSLHSQAIGPTIESPTAQKVATVATVTVAGALIYAAKTIIPHLLRRWI